jgi:ribosomal protein S27E
MTCEEEEKESKGSFMLHCPQCKEIFFGSLARGQIISRLVKCPKCGNLVLLYGREV